MPLDQVVPIEGAELQDRGSAPAAFKCLDVWNKRQGELRLWLYGWLVAWLVLVAVYWQFYELLCLSVENIDTRDIVDDYRLSHDGVHSWHEAHWRAPGAGPELDVCSTQGADGACAHQQPQRPIVNYIDKDPNMIDPRFQAIYSSNLRLDFMQPSHTDYDYAVTAYNYEMELDPARDYFAEPGRGGTAKIDVRTPPNATTTPSAPCAGHPATLPLYHTEYIESARIGTQQRRFSARDSPRLMQSLICHTEVRYLTKAVVEAAWYRGCYQVQQVMGTYSEAVWRGDLGATPDFAPCDPSPLRPLALPPPPRRRLKKPCSSRGVLVGAGRSRRCRWS